LPLPGAPHAFGRSPLQHGLQLRHQLDVAPHHETGEFGLGGRPDIQEQLLHGTQG